MIDKTIEDWPRMELESAHYWANAEDTVTQSDRFQVKRAAIALSQEVNALTAELKQLREVEAGKWVAVNSKDDLPKHNGRYLTSFWQGTYRVEDFNSHRHDYWLKNVRAYMPIPTYTEGE